MTENSMEELISRANAGDAEAQNALGLKYAREQNPESEQMAEKWFRRAAEQGFARAQHNLGVILLRRDDIQGAFAYFQEAAKRAYLPAMFAAAGILEEAGHLDRARIIFEMAARRGHAESQDALCRIHIDAGTDADYEQAIYWGKLAAEQGLASAQARLGTNFHEGLGTPRNPELAAAYFLAAAKQGHPGAQFMIGGACHLGIGIEADRVEAAHWLIRSAEQGNELADAYLRRYVLTELAEKELAQALARAREPLG